MNEQEQKAYVRRKSEELVKLFLLIVKSYQVTEPKDWEWQIENFIFSITKDYQLKVSKNFLVRINDELCSVASIDRFRIEDSKKYSQIIKKAFEKAGVELEK